MITGSVAEFLQKKENLFLFYFGAEVIRYKNPQKINKKNKTQTTAAKISLSLLSLKPIKIPLKFFLTYHYIKCT